MRLTSSQSPIICIHIAIAGYQQFLKNRMEAPGPFVSTTSSHVYSSICDKDAKRHKGRVPIPIGGSTKGTTLTYGEWAIRIKGNGARLGAKQLSTAQEVIKKLKMFKGAISQGVLRHSGSHKGQRDPYGKRKRNVRISGDPIDPFSNNLMFSGLLRLQCANRTCNF